MSFPPYESYRDSGEKWLGKLPSHWNVGPLKHVIQSGRPITYGIVQAGPDVAYGVPYIRPADMDEEAGVVNEAGLLRTAPEIAQAYQRSEVRAGDLVCSIGPSFGKVMVVPSSLSGANLTQGTARVAIRAGTAPRYVFWALRSLPSFAQWESSVGGATFRALNLEPLANTVISLPPATEQASIAAFLDRETAKIDALVDEQRRLIELLKEKRQAVISHAVTKGLDPTAPMKDSGVEWLGEVPAHWRVCLLKRAFQEIDYGISDSLDLEGAVAVLRMGNIQDGGITLADLKYVGQVEPELLLRPLDLLFNRTNSLDQIGKVGMIVDLPDTPLTFASYLVRLRVEASCMPAFMAFLLNAEGILGEARARAFVAIGQCNLNPTRYGEIVVALPPLNEQAGIAQFIERESALLDQLRAEAELAIALLGERRAALISAAVTGKIDVRGPLSRAAEAAAA